MAGQEQDGKDAPPPSELSFPERTQVAYYPVSQNATQSSRSHGWAETSPSLRIERELNGKPEGMSWGGEGPQTHTYPFPLVSLCTNLSPRRARPYTSPMGRS